MLQMLKACSRTRCASKLRSRDLVAVGEEDDEMSNSKVGVRWTAALGLDPVVPKQPQDAEKKKKKKKGEERSPPPTTMLVAVGTSLDVQDGLRKLGTDM
ncbi:hypothetical protein PHYPSEUDO_015353 [Phytophthora pseudosyringae]|uniref:Uncharacterized protein n=1 Tax=Phytophthora pseudosyringae TaxID=221518 RepID=A0A8T1V643_9STRA|nr:hypothetical protein PHYPSEUDO_015353 [Phytophthora pseudosyringae]